MISDIVMDLLVERPYFGYLAGKVRFVQDNSIKTTATSFKDGLRICYNPEWFDHLSKDHQRGAILHELMHLGLLHFFRRDGRDPETWHMACDLAVSSLMREEEIHKDILTTSALYYEAVIFLPAKQSAEFYYEQLKDNESSVDYTYKTDSGEIKFKDGRTYQGGPLEEPEKNDLQIKALIDELASVQAASYSEDGMDKDLGAQTEGAFSGYKVHWRNLLKKFLTGQGRINKRKSYKRQSRRFDDLPGNKRSIGVRALVAVDESGSVSNEDVRAFHQELIRINGINNAHITAVRFDTTCSEPVPLKQFVAENKRAKKGGTDFRPIFELADRLRMPLVVVFTDGMGEAPVRVNQKVLWVLTGNGRIPADYGIAVRYTEDQNELQNSVRSADRQQTLLWEGDLQTGEQSPSAHRA